MGFRKEIKIRFLIILVASLIVTGSFSYKYMQPSQDVKPSEFSDNQSGRCSLMQTWKSGHILKSVLEQMENSPHKQVDSILLTGILEYVNLGREPPAGVRYVKPEGSLFWPAIGIKQSETFKGLARPSLFQDVSRQLLIALLFILKASILSAAACQVRNALRKRESSQFKKYVLANLEAVLNIFVPSKWHSASTLDEKICENEEVYFKENKKSAWMYDPLRWVGRFTEYFSFTVLDRVASFRPISSNIPSTNGPAFLKLAEAGFRYPGEGSNVECEECRNVVNIERFNSPAVGAIYHRGGCSYIKEHINVASNNMTYDSREVETDSVEESVTQNGHAIYDRNATTINNYETSTSFRTQPTSNENKYGLSNPPLDRTSNQIPPSNKSSPNTAADRRPQLNGHECKATHVQQAQINKSPVRQLTNQALAVAPEHNTQVAVLAPGQTNQTSSLAPQQTSKSVALTPQQTNESVALTLQQSNQAAALSPQQTNQAAALSPQQTSQTAAQSTEQKIQTSVKEQHQKLPGGNSQERGACAASVNPTHSAPTPDSSLNNQLFDLEEFEAEHENSEYSVQHHRDNCTKNPGHFANFPMEQLQQDYIPSNVRIPEVYQLLNLTGKLVVRLVVNSISQDRPDFSKENLLPKCRYGTGIAIPQPADKDTTTNSDQPGKWNTVRKYIPLIRNKGFIYIDTSRHLVYDDHEAQHTQVEFFFDNSSKKGIVNAKGVSIKHSEVLGDFRSTLKCKINDLSMIEFVKKTDQEIRNLAKGLPQRIKEGMMKRVFLISHPHGGEKMMSYGEHVMVKYQLKIEMKNEQPRPKMVKINNHTQISQNHKEIRKVLLYTAEACKGSSGGVVIAFTKENNDIELDFWMHNGVCKKHGLNASAMRELTPDDIADHGNPNSYRPSVQDNQEAEAGSTANQVVSCPVFTVMGSPTHPAYAIYKKRLDSYPNPFVHIHTPANLADAGFFYAGYGDCVRCFQCGLGLRSWQQGDCIYEEHNRNRPDCQFLQMKLKASGINLSGPQSSDQNRTQTSAGNLTAEHPANEPQPRHQSTPTTMMKQLAAQSTIQDSQRESSMGNNLQQQGAQQIFNAQSSDRHETSVKMIPTNSSTNQPEETRKRTTSLYVLEREQAYLKQLLTCKVCCKNPVKDLFLPCGELVACIECSKLLTHCPSCDQKILATVTTFFS